MAIVRKATAWERPPAIYKPSVDYFKAHFEDLDPEQPHDFPPVDRAPMLSVTDLALAGAAYGGLQINVVGKILQTPQLVMPISQTVGSFAIFVHDPELPRAQVICRVPLKLPHDFAAGDRVAISGVLLAVGGTDTGDDRGFRTTAYMACSSVAHSRRIVLRGAPRSQGVR
jgi:hypothetical protein